MNTLLTSCLPRVATARTGRDTHGDKVAQVAEMLGQPFMPWQQQVVDTALEIDEHGRFAYRTVAVTVPRQQGKSTLALARMVWTALTVKGSRVSYTAQTGHDARLKLVNDWGPSVEDSKLKPLIKQVYRGAGSEAIVFTNRSRIEAMPTTLTAGHGRTLDFGVIDEAFSDVDDRRMQAMLPAMATKQDAQIWIVSTAGTDESAFLKRIVSEGREHAANGVTTGTCYFEWAADPDADPDDPATWHSCIPALGHTIGPEVVAHARQTMPDGDFRRAWLNQWTRTDERVIPKHIWDAAQDDAMPDGRLVFGADITLDRSSGTIVVADEHGRVELIDNREGVDWMPDRLVELATKHDGAIVLDTYGPAGMLAETLENRKIRLVTYTTRDACYAANLFYDDLMTGKMRVRPHQALNVAVAAAEKKPLGASWLWVRFNPQADVSPLHAATIAYHCARHRNKPAGKPSIF